MKFHMFIAAAVLVGGTTATFAGEITGQGTLKEVKGKSVCAFSGLEDAEDFFAPGVVQTFGRHPNDVFTGGVSDNRDNIPNSPGPAAPGVACNPSGAEPS